MVRVIDCPTHCQKGTNWVANLCIFNCIILHFSIAKYTKALGDDLYFLTESFHRKNNIYNGKYSMADFITPKALHILQQKEKVRLIFEHMVPKNLYLNMLVEKAKQGNLTYTEIYNVLMKYYYTCTVTKDEDNLLPSTKMQDGWDGQNPFF